MPKFVFDFDLDVWMQNVEIEAEDYEEAVEKLNRMSVSDIVDEGYAKDFNIKDVDYEIEKEEEEEYYG